MNGDISSTEGVSKPRIVNLQKGSQGYGFNLHGEKGVHGQFISAVDEESPADIGGLLIGDRVVEVNGFNVEGATHAEVVNKIKGNPNEATLLVVDKITDAYLKKIGRSVSASLASIESPTVVEPSHTETVQENGESTEHEVVQDTTNEEELAVRQMEAATLESAPPEIEETEPEPVVSPPEIEVPEPEPEIETKEEVEVEESAPEPEVIHSAMGNGDVEYVPEPVVPEPEPEPEPVVPEPSPVIQTPVEAPVPAEPVPDPAMKIEKIVPIRKQIKQQKTENWKNKKELFDNL